MWGGGGGGRVSVQVRRLGERVRIMSWCEGSWGGGGARRRVLNGMRVRWCGVDREGLHPKVTGVA